MKKKALLILFIIGLTTAIGGNAAAVTLGFGPIVDNSNQPVSGISFQGGTNPYFQFYGPSSGAYADFSLTITFSDSALGSSLGYIGHISGQFNIGAISNYTGYQSATVTGSFDPKLTITDENNSVFTGQVNWIDIRYQPAGSGGSGTLNPQGHFNLTPVSYGGADLDLIALMSGGAANVTFNFTNINSLEDLTATGIHKTSFAGEITSVPAPSTILLLGSGLVGLLALRRRRKVQ